MDIEKLGAALAPIVRAEVAKATEALRAEIADLKAREMPVPEKGDPGNDADPNVIAKMIADAVAALPTPKDGVSPSAEDVAACFERRFSEFLLAGERRIYEMADKAIDRMPRPKDGVDGI